MSESSLPHLSDVALYQHEWRMLLECTSPFRDTLKVAEMLRSCDAPRLVALAEEHGVIGHLARALRDLDGGLLAPEIKQALLERHRAQVFFSLRITGELFRLLDRFATEGIAALVVKGPVLSEQAYGDPAMRAYGDLDLLVRQRDIRRTTELMIAAGYEARVSLEAIDAGKVPGQYLFQQPDAKLLVELHNDFTLRYFPRRLPLEKFLARQIRVPLDAREAPALSVEDELVLICIHGAKHFWERLLWIADVAALVSRQSGIDWERAAESAQETGAERILHTGLCLAVDLLRARLPDHVSAAVKSDRAAVRLTRRIEKWLPAAGYAPPGLFERAVFRLRMRGSWFAAPSYLLRLSLSPTEDDWEEGGEISEHGFLVAIRRPFRLARKYGRGKQ